MTTANAEFAQGFTTGAADDGYTLGSVGLYLPSAPGSATLTVSLRAADGDNPSTTVLHALTNPQTFVIGTNYFAAPANTVLAKDTPYFVVVSGSAAFSLGIVPPTARTRAARPAGPSRTGRGRCSRARGESCPPTITSPSRSGARSSSPTTPPSAPWA